MKILDGEATRSEITDLLQESKWARVAVAYWGAGASEVLKLEDFAGRKPDVQIACDLMSGATNPKEVEELIRLFGRDAVKAVSNLHAKVWLTDAGAIIGSSNASANGLGHEGTEKPVAGLVEANVRFPPLDRSMRDQWEAWFVRLWDGGDEITKPMLNLAKKRWKERRRLRDVLIGRRERDDPAGSLLDKLRTAPDFFRDKPLTIWAWKPDELSKTEIALLAHERVSRHSSRLDCYGRVELKPGQYILDAYWDADRETFRMEGLYKAAEDETIVRSGRSFISVVYPVSSFEGLTFRGEARAWKQAILAVIAKSRNKTEMRLTAERFGLALQKL